VSNEFKAVPIEAFNRAIVMLSVAGNHCEDHAMSAISHYDDADCDGICINDDCKTVIEWLQQAHDGEVVYLIYHGDGECAVDEVSKADYDEHDGPKRILYTAPSRVVDEAMVQRAALAMFTPPISNDRMDDVRAGLKAALEKT